MDDLKKKIEGLITKSTEAPCADDALKFSQAALNASHALCTLNDPSIPKAK